MMIYMEAWMPSYNQIKLDDGQIFDIPTNMDPHDIVSVIDHVRIEDPDLLSDVVYHMSRDLYGVKRNDIQEINPELKYCLECIPRENKIHKIKLCRKLTGLGLKEAKDIVDALEERYRLDDAPIKQAADELRLQFSSTR